MGQVELDSSVDVAGPQFRERYPFGLVVLADVLIEGMHDPTMAFDQGAHGPTDRDGTQLAVVTHHHHLRSGVPGLVEQEGDVPVGGHPCLVEHQDMAFGEPHPLVFELPPEGGQGPRVGKAGLPTEGPGRLAGGRGPHHGEAS